MRVNFSFSKPPGNPQKTVIQATFTNLSQNIYTDFIFQAAVPKVRHTIIASQLYLDLFAAYLSFRICVVHDLSSLATLRSFYSYTWIQPAATL